MYSLGSIFPPNHYNFLVDFTVTLRPATAEIQNCQSCLSLMSSQFFKSTRLPVRLISVMMQVTVRFDKLLIFVRA